MTDSDASESETQRKVFGGGLKRKRIEFVPAGRPPPITPPSTTPTLSLSEWYLFITLKDGTSSATEAKTETDIVVTSTRRESQEAKTTSWRNENSICSICQGLIDMRTAEPTTALPGHEASLAHQVCLEHSHPPSHLDRNRHGLRYLSSYGWDPDSQLGLGASGAGIRVPVKVKAKHDTVGLGVKVPKWDQDVATKKETLDAKGLRTRQTKEDTKREVLQQMFYAKDDVQKYLGIG